MNATELLVKLRSQGVMLEANGDCLRVDAPKGAMTSELREALAANKAEVLALLKVNEEEIAWRVTAMLPQIPSRGPIPLLIARTEIETKPGQCVSCGILLQAGDGFLCTPCGRAANLALEVAMLKATPPDEKSD